MSGRLASAPHNEPVTKTDPLSTFHGPYGFVWRVWNMRSEKENRINARKTENGVTVPKSCASANSATRPTCLTSICYVYTEKAPPCTCNVLVTLISTEQTTRLYQERANNVLQPIHSRVARQVASRLSQERQETNHLRNQGAAEATHIVRRFSHKKRKAERPMKQRKSVPGSGTIRNWSGVRASSLIRNSSM